MSAGAINNRESMKHEHSPYATVNLQDKHGRHGLYESSISNRKVPRAINVRPSTKGIQWQTSYNREVPRSFNVRPRSSHNPYPHPISNPISTPHYNHNHNPNLPASATLFIVSEDQRYLKGFPQKSPLCLDLRLWKLFYPNPREETQPTKIRPIHLFGILRVAMIGWVEGLSFYPFETIYRGLKGYTP